jgi:hypothetical protein
MDNCKAEIIKDPCPLCGPKAVKVGIHDHSDTEFERELKNLINKHCMENLSNTPDYILAKFLNSCLISFSEAIRDREFHRF